MCSVRTGSAAALSLKPSSPLQRPLPVTRLDVGNVPGTIACSAVLCERLFHRTGSALYQKESLIDAKETCVRVLPHMRDDKEMFTAAGLRRLVEAYSQNVCVDKALPPTFTVKLLEPCLRMPFLLETGALLHTCRDTSIVLSDIRICSCRSPAALHVPSHFQARGKAFDALDMKKMYFAAP